MNNKNLQPTTSLSRRRFLSTMAAAGTALGISTGFGNKTAESAQPKPEQINSPDKKIYWGDIHNHNAVGYAKGSLERSYDIANSTLDFFCFTGHSQWHDMPKMPQNKHMKWDINIYNITNILSRHLYNFIIIY